MTVSRAFAPDHRARRDPGLSTSTLAASCPSITFRMINHWMSHGVITPSIAGPRGSGQPVRWSAHDLDRLKIIERVMLVYPYRATPAEVVKAVWEALENHATLERNWLVITPGPAVRIYDDVALESGVEPAIVVPLAGF